MKRIEATITGRVQMVMYRDFAKRKARSLGLAGFVKNNNDGSVSVAAEGEKENLKKLIEYLKKGPLLAKVDSVNVSWREPAGEFSSFIII